MPKLNAVAYYRVSTTKQGLSGLGLEAQQRAVQSFTESRGIELLQEISEIETATNKKHRPKLQEALDICKRQNCPIVVSSVDRISRNVGIMGAIMNSGVQILIADLPNADTFVINILASVAQREAESISARTKAGLRSAKLRGTKLGNPQNFKDEHRLLGAQKRKEAAATSDAVVCELVKSKRREGMSMQKIANLLNSLKANGKTWYPSQVFRILKN